MKNKKLTIVGYVTGLLVILASIVRWFIIWNDPSQAILGSSIGIVILGGAYAYQRFSELTEDIRDLNKGMDAFRIWNLDEFEKLKKEE